MSIKDILQIGEEMVIADYRIGVNDKPAKRPIYEICKINFDLKKFRSGFKSLDGNLNLSGYQEGLRQAVECYFYKEGKGNSERHVLDFKSRSGEIIKVARDYEPIQMSKRNLTLAVASARFVLLIQDLEDYLEIDLEIPNFIMEKRFDYFRDEHKLFESGFMTRLNHLFGLAEETRWFSILAVEKYREYFLDIPIIKVIENSFSEEELVLAKKLLEKMKFLEKIKQQKIAEDLFQKQPEKIQACIMSLK